MSVEGGNFYPDAILRQENREDREEQQALDTALQEQAERTTVSTESQEGIGSLQESIQRQQGLQEMLDMFEESLEGMNIEGFDVFKNFILGTHNTAIQDSFLDEFDSIKIWEVAERSGRFPVNEFEFQQSLVEGTILDSADDANASLTDALQDNTTQTEAAATEIEADVIETEAVATETEAEEINQKEKNILKLHNLLQVRDNIPNQGAQRILGLIDSNLISEIESGDYQDDTEENLLNIREQLRNYFSQPNILETEILPQARASGNYEAVRNSLIELGGGENGEGGIFEARIQAWEMTPSYGELPAEQMIRVSGALGTRVDEVSTDAEQSGNIFTLRQADGTEINYDVVTNNRSLELDGYSLRSQVEDQGDYQTPKLEYMRVEQEHLPKLQKIVAAGQALEAAQISDENVTEIKNVLKGENALGYSYYMELGIDVLTTAVAIQERLQQAYSEHNTPLEAAREEYRNTLMVLRDEYQRALREKDEKTKEVLRFLQSIGFTLIPQNITDALLAMINRSPSIWSELGMNEEIDLANGQLGFDRNAGEGSGIDLSDKRGFVSLMNMMLTGDPTIPVEYINDRNIQYHVDIPASGVEVSDQDSEQILRAAYMNMLQGIVGSSTFEIQARQNLGL